MSVKNAKQLPKLYVGLHMEPGVAEYREPDKQPYRILIGEEAIKNMDPSFQGRPVYVRHKDEVNLEDIQIEADGYVVRSFFNASDGKHWVEFIVVSDRGHEAIRSGWKLSNAYVPKDFKAGGSWHGVDYQKEVSRAEYEHLAIVPNPRYEGSVIMTPEQFKDYNGEKQIEIKRLANSKGEKKVGLLHFFKKEKIENSVDLEQTVVMLPKSKEELTITQLVNEVDTYRETMKEPMADLPHHMGNSHVMVGEEKMSINDLVSKHMAMKQELADLHAKHNTAKEGPDELAEKKETEEVPKKNEEKDMKEEPMKNEPEKEEKKEEVKKNSVDHFASLKNAPDAVVKVTHKVELTEDKIARGKSRYGSN